MPHESSSEPAAAPPAISRFGPLVGLLASIAMCAQHAALAGMAGLALILGLGPLALLMFLPLALGLGLLWAGFVYLRRRQHRRGLSVFVGYALVLLALNQWLSSPSQKAGSSERALRSAEVLGLRDEAVSTASGAPIGMRVVVDVRFPRRIVGRVSVSAFSPREGEPAWLYHLLEFRRFEQTILPSPGSEGGQDVFEKDVVYRVDAVRMPGSRTEFGRTDRPCREALPGIDEGRILHALNQRGERRYSVKVSVSSEAVATEVVVAEHETSRSYDLAAMYRNAIQERIQPCVF